MRTVGIAVLLLAGLMVQGCTTAIKARGIEATDLSYVEPGVFRSDVEAQLGSPIETHAIDGRKVAVYEYDMGRPPQELTDRDFGLGGPVCQGMPLVCLFIALGGQPFAIHHMYESQKGALWVTYGPDDAVLRFATVAKERRHDWREWEQRTVALIAKAERGDAEAQFALAEEAVTESERLLWLCKSAHGGHPRAQFRMAMRYGVNADQTDRQDDVQAYVWYSLAASNGDESAEASQERTAARMTPAEIAEAERLVMGWAPDPSSCEIEAAQAEAPGK